MHASRYYFIGFTSILRQTIIPVDYVNIVSVFDCLWTGILNLHMIPLVISSTTSYTPFLFYSLLR
jgi:hypothetical protein